PSLGLAAGRSQSGTRWNRHRPVKRWISSSGTLVKRGGVWADVAHLRRLRGTDPVSVLWPTGPIRAGGSSQRHLGQGWLNGDPQVDQAASWRAAGPAWRSPGLEVGEDIAGGRGEERPPRQGGHRVTHESDTAVPQATVDAAGMPAARPLGDALIDAGE